MLLRTGREHPEHSEPPHHVGYNRPGVATPVCVADDQRCQCCQGKKSNWRSPQETDLVKVARRFLRGGMRKHCPAEYGHDGEDDEEHEVEDEHDGGKNGQTVELVGQLVHEDSQNPGAHGNREPLWREIFDCILPRWLSLFLVVASGMVDLMVACIAIGIFRWRDVLRLSAVRLHIALDDGNRESRGSVKDEGMFCS